MGKNKQTKEHHKSKERNVASSKRKKSQHRTISSKENTCDFHNWVKARVHFQIEDKIKSSKRWRRHLGKFASVAVSS